MDALMLEGRLRACAPPFRLALDLGNREGLCGDRAVDALRASGVRSGRVNAGGDLRGFGAGMWVPVCVPSGNARLTLHMFDVRDAAVATRPTPSRHARRAR